MILKNMWMIQEQLQGDGGDAGGGSLATGGTSPDVTSSNAGDLQGATPAADQIIFPDNWKDGLPEDLRGSASLEAFKSIPDVVKAFVETKKMVGRQGVHLPDKHATAEDWHAWRVQNMGFPEKIEDYGLSVSDDLGFEDGVLTKLKEAMFKGGVSPQAGEGLLGTLAEIQSAQREAAVQKAEADAQDALEALKKQWGEAFNPRVSRISNSLKEIAEEAGDENIYSWLDNIEVEGMKLGNHPNMLRILGKLAAEQEEDIVVGETDRAMSPESIENEIQRIMGDKSHPYWDASHPNHKNAVKEVERLSQRLYG